MLLSSRLKNHYMYADLSLMSFCFWHRRQRTKLGLMDVYTARLVDLFVTQERMFNSIRVRHMLLF